MFSRGAAVPGEVDLNPLMGRPWYESAREVTRTLVRKIAGTHQDISLAKGTKKEYRRFAQEFVEFLIKEGVLTKVIKSDSGPGFVVKLNADERGVITDFSKDGKVGGKLKPFFDKYIG